MFNYIYEEVELRTVKFSKKYLIDISVLFAVFYSLPFVFIIVCIKSSLSPILCVIAELLLVFVDVFLVYLHLNIFKFKIEIFKEEFSFKCLSKDLRIKKNELKTIGIIRRAGTALTLNSYSDSTVYFSRVEVDSSKMYKNLWEKHIISCGIIKNDTFFVSGHSKYVSELYTCFLNIAKQSPNVTVNDNDRADF